MSDNRRMNNLRYAVDAYDGDLARRKCSKQTRSKYGLILGQLIDFLGRSKENPSEITREDCQRFLDQWRDSSSSTMALHHSILNGFFRFLVRETALEVNPMANIGRPRRTKPEDLDVVTITDSDVDRLIQACRRSDELVCIAMLAYLGPRRSALANLRRRDIDLERGTVRFQEKGAKTIIKPMPRELHALLKELNDAGEWLEGDEWIVKNRGNRGYERKARIEGERSDQVVYRIVKDVAKRARVTTHVHALRAAFATRFLESHPGDLDALQHLLGHERADTTRVYLRRQDRFSAMERVRDLTWGNERSLTEPDRAQVDKGGGIPSDVPTVRTDAATAKGRAQILPPGSVSDRGFPLSPAMPPTGFEPVFSMNPSESTLARKLAAIRTESATNDRLEI